MICIINSMKNIIYNTENNEKYSNLSQNVLYLCKAKDRKCTKCQNQRNHRLPKASAMHLMGIFTCIRKERNMKIHCVMAVLVMIAGIILKLSPVEWCICLALFGLVMALELVNTAVEAVVDLVTSEYKPLAKIAKDTAAGAVLIAAIMAAIADLLFSYRRDWYFLELYDIRII